MFEIVFCSGNTRIVFAKNRMEIRRNFSDIWAIYRVEII